MLACIDSNILSLVIQVRNRSQQPELVMRARRLFSELSSKNATILLPALVVAEFVSGLSNQKYQQVIEVLAERSFRIIPFDYDAIGHFHQINATLPLVGATAKERRPMKLDRLIVASAVSARADIFYSNDEDCLKMAQTFMTAEDLPL